MAIAFAEPLAQSAARMRLVVRLAEEQGDEERTNIAIWRGDVM